MDYVPMPNLMFAVIYILIGLAISVGSLASSANARARDVFAVICFWPLLLLVMLYCALSVKQRN